MSKKNKRQKQDALKMNILKTFDIVGDNEDSELEEERSAPGFTADYRDKDLGGVQDRPGLPPRDPKRKLEPELFDEIPEPELPRPRQKRTPSPPLAKAEPALEKPKEKETEPLPAVRSETDAQEAEKEPDSQEQETPEKPVETAEEKPEEEAKAPEKDEKPEEKEEPEEWHIPEPPEQLRGKKEEASVEENAGAQAENTKHIKNKKGPKPAPKINETEKPEVETVKIYREKAGQGSVPEWAQETTEIPLEKIRENMVVQNAPASEGFVVRKTEGGATIPVRVKPKKGANGAKKSAAGTAAAEKKQDRKIRKIDEFFGDLPEERVQGWFERPTEDSAVFSADYRDGKNEKPVKAPRRSNLAPLDDEPEADEFMQEPDSSEGLLKKWNAASHPATGSASVADLVQGRRKTGKHRYGVVVGSIVLLFALVGVAFIAGSIGSRVYRFATDDSALRAYDALLTPVVMQDPAPFEDITKADESMVLISSMWKTITANNGTNYTEYDDAGRVVVPLGDVVSTSRELFGPDCQLQPKTPEGGSFFEYDSEENKFHVARYSSDSTYTPYTESERKRGDSITLHVGYVSPSDEWRAENGQSTKPTPTKYMDYVLKKNPSTGALYVFSVQAAAGQVKGTESASK